MGLCAKHTGARFAPRKKKKYSSSEGGLSARVRAEPNYCKKDNKDISA